MQLFDIRSYEEQISYLIDMANPFMRTGYTKNAILLTTFVQKNIGESLLTKQQKDRNKSSQSRTKKIQYQQSWPQIISYEQELKTTVINSRNYLFQNKNNEFPTQTTLNLLYLLSIYEQLYFIFVFHEREIVGNDKKSVLEFLATLFNLLELFGAHKGQVKQAIGILIQNDTENSSQKYMQQLNNLLKSNKTCPGAPILQNILKTNRVFTSTPKKALIPQINNRITPLKTSPKTLTSLYKTLLSSDQIVFLIKLSEKVYKQKCKQALLAIKEGIEAKDIYSEDQQERRNALYVGLEVRMPVKGFRFLLNLEKIKKVQHFAIQAVIFVLIDLFNLDNQFYESNLGDQYEDFNKQNDKTEWEQTLSNLSIVGYGLGKLFSQKTMFESQVGLSSSAYFHILLRVFENVPQINIRQYQKQQMNKMQEIIEYIMQFLFSQLYQRVQELVQGDISPSKLMNLTCDIHQLKKFLLKLKQKKYEPYQSKEDEIEEKIVYIIAAFFFSAWKCYQIYDKFWSQGQKNKFMMDLYEICQVENYTNVLIQIDKPKILKIIKKTNQYFGDWCSNNNLDYFAIKFYSASKLNWKLIQANNRLLQLTLDKGSLDSQIIRSAIDKFCELGLTEQARKWCYKFMDTVDQNSQFISMLENIADFERNENKMIIEQIGKLKYDNVMLVDAEHFHEIKADLKVEEWLDRVGSL